MGYGLFAIFSTFGFIVFFILLGLIIYGLILFIQLSSLGIRALNIYLKNNE
ncbi:hypothetical protein [Clostridium sp. DJ247]|uniref:hypothetical protein n=1 Tax=Clostridium sp. DJ247 TaxID=2726188 RepID=UPI001625155D|nr:hypothetical protein [Clostridium sp. DJ247]MBC2581124.1 hypothetical protein [Clostridium sp. DJ247]